MANKELSKAELYREERKERIAKANKKNAKGIASGKKVAGFFKKVVAIVIVLAIVAGLAYKINDSFGIAERMVTALKVGDEKVSATEFNYYYSTMYQQTNYYAQYYSQYGMNMGFSTDVAPNDETNTTTDADGNTITWAESFKNSAKDRAQFVLAYYGEAKKAGLELTDEDKTTIDESIEEYRTQAAENNFSLNAYLRASFGGGFSEKLYRKLLERETLAQNFYSQKQEELKKGISAEDIEKEYKDNRAQYDYADIVYYSFDFSTLTAEEGETDEDLAKRQTKANNEVKADAKKVYESSNDLAAFKDAVKAYKDEGSETKSDTDYTTELKTTTYSAVSSSISEKAADWALDSARKAGDKKMITDESGAYIIFVTKPAYTSNSVDVRHLLVNFNAADEENVTDEEDKAAKEKAQALLDEWKAGDKTEESFAALAKENSEDQGSAEEGGLYAGMRITDSYVDEFLNWSFNAKRKAGDTGIIKTTYGYHIMYFVADNTEDLDWQNTIREAKGSDAFTAYDEALLGDEGDYVINATDFWCDYVMNKFCNKIKKNLALSASSSN